MIGHTEGVRKRWRIFHNFRSGSFEVHKCEDIKGDSGMLVINGEENYMDWEQMRRRLEIRD